MKTKRGFNRKSVSLAIFLAFAHLGAVSGSGGHTGTLYHSDLFKLIRANKINGDTRDDEKSGSGRDPGVKELLNAIGDKQGVDIDMMCLAGDHPSYFETNALLLAVSEGIHHGNAEIVEMILENGADANVKIPKQKKLLSMMRYGKEGLTPLDIAYTSMRHMVDHAKRGGAQCSLRDEMARLTIVELLLRNGADIEACTPIVKGHLSGFRLLTDLMYHARDITSSESRKVCLSQCKSAKDVPKFIQERVRKTFSGIITTLLENGAALPGGVAGRPINEWADPGKVERYVAGGIGYWRPLKFDWCCNHESYLLEQQWFKEWIQRMAEQTLQIEVAKNEVLRCEDIIQVLNEFTVSNKYNGRVKALIKKRIIYLLRGDKYSEYKKLLKDYKPPVSGMRTSSQSTASGINGASQTARRYQAIRAFLDDILKD